MEQLKKLLADMVKLEEAESQIPPLEMRRKELKEIVDQRKLERDWAVLTAKNLEEPGFFQRLLGRVAEKQEKAQAEARQAAADYEASRRELDEVEYQLNALRGACAELSGSRGTYDRARLVYSAKADTEELHQLRWMETEVLRPVVVDILRRIREALNAARGWVTKELRPRYGALQTRRMEYMDLADAYAERLVRLTAYFPEGSITLGASMTSPGDYVRSVSTNLSQVDLLNIAIEQSLRVQEQVEKL